ncbi:MAG: hypothetical protein KAS32_22450 [Candidatus Peribacteraceae bacterium]|nr:hypothetical protein [Candidatus Peribacteraceae bacterium]
MNADNEDKKYLLRAQPDHGPGHVKDPAQITKLMILFKNLPIMDKKVKCKVLDAPFEKNGSLFMRVVDIGSQFITKPYIVPLSLYGVVPYEKKSPLWEGHNYLTTSTP